jgi:hypothetical protein
VNTDADRDLSALYRAASSEEPPSWLDAAILTAAERDLGRAGIRASRGWRWRWQAPLAVAAVLTLAVSLALVMEGELGDTTASPPPLPTAVTPPQASHGRAEAPAAQSAGAISGETRDRAEHERSRAAKADAPAPQQSEAARGSRMQSSLPQSPPPRPAPEGLKLEHEHAEAAAAPAPPPASAPNRSSPAAPSPFPREQRAEPAAESGMNPPSADAGVQPGKPAQSDSQRNFGQPRLHSPAPAAKREQLPADDERSKQLAAPQAGASPTAQDPARKPSERSEAQRDALMTPEQWLREIEQLRRDGREALARERLDQFRKRFPDYPLPESWQ